MGLGKLIRRGNVSYDPDKILECAVLQYGAPSTTNLYVCFRVNWKNNILKRSVCAPSGSHYIYTALATTSAGHCDVVYLAGARHHPRNVAHWAQLRLCTRLRANTAGTTGLSPEPRAPSRCGQCSRIILRCYTATLDGSTPSSSSSPPNDPPDRHRPAETGSTTYSAGASQWLYIHVSVKCSVCCGRPKRVRLLLVVRVPLRAYEDRTETKRHRRRYRFHPSGRSALAHRTTAAAAAAVLTRWLRVSVIGRTERFAGITIYASVRGR